MIRVIKSFLVATIFIVVCQFDGTAWSFSQPGDITVDCSWGAYRFEGNQELKHGMISLIGINRQFDEQREIGFSAGVVDTAKTVVPYTHEDGYLLSFYLRQILFGSGRWWPHINIGFGASTVDMGKKDLGPVVSSGLGFRYYFTDKAAVAVNVDYWHHFKGHNDNISCMVGLVFNVFRKPLAPSLLLHDEWEKVQSDVPVGFFPGEDGRFIHDDLLRQAVPISPHLPTGITPNLSIAQPPDHFFTEDRDVHPKPPLIIGIQPALPEDVSDDIVEPPVTVIYFDRDSADIDNTYLDSLKVVADFLQEHPQARVHISGHTDNTGNRNYNLRLAEKRARNTKHFMIEHFGLPEQCFELSWFGPDKPAADNHSLQGQMKNRRGEITVNLNEE